MRVLRLLALLMLVLATYPASVPTPPVAAQAAPQSFLATFDGSPASVQGWRQQPWQAGWDVAVHSRDVATFDTLESMPAQHGANCSAPPATHPNSSYDTAVFQCADHVMTAIQAGGYGLITLTPSALLDWSAGEATLRWDMSTLQQAAAGRDFIDVFIIPWNDVMQLPFDLGDVDLQGVPKNAVFIKLNPAASGGTGFVPQIIRNFQGTSDFRQWSGDYDDFLAYESFLAPSASRRDTFELKLSKTHLSFCMPGYSKCWANKTIQQLPFTQGLVVFGHHSYNPTKCDTSCPLGSGKANTWHIDNFYLSPAVPITLIKGDKRVAQGSGAPATVTMTAPAPANTMLRFSAIGQNIQVSYDGGAFAPAQKPGQNFQGDVEGHFSNYWTPVPAGARTIRLQGANWYGGPWRAKDFAFFSQTTPIPPTPTPAPTATASPTATGVPPTATDTPVPPPTPTEPALTATPPPPFPTPTVAPTAVPGDGGHLLWRGQSVYLHGANLPWWNWACDFGCGTGGGVSGNRATINSLMAQARQAGMRNVRWWMFEGADPWQIGRDGNGRPTMLNPTVYDDLDAALELARANGLTLHMVLFSNSSHIPASWRSNADHRAALVAALTPLFQRYGTDPNLMTWEFINEPESGIWNENVDAGQVQALVRDLNAAVRASGVTMTTIGSIWPDGLPLWVGLGLSYYSVHWYDYQSSGDYCTRCRTSTSLHDQYGLDRPVVIGEFPADVGYPDSRARFDDWKRLGYAGAFAWSLAPSRTNDHIGIDYNAASGFAAANGDIGPVPAGPTPTPTPTPVPTPLPATATVAPATATQPPTATPAPIPTEPPPTATTGPPTATAEPAATATATASPVVATCRVQVDLGLGPQWMTCQDFKALLAALP